MAQNFYLDSYKGSLLTLITGLFCLGILLITIVFKSLKGVPRDIEHFFFF